MSNLAISKYRPVLFYAVSQNPGPFLSFCFKLWVQFCYVVDTFYYLSIEYFDGPKLSFRIGYLASHWL